MRRKLGMAWIGAVAALATGCMTGPITENPVLIRPNPDITVENPVWIPPGPAAYGAVFEKVLDIVGGYFEIRYANRYDGHLDTFPRIAPGFEQYWKPGSPDAYQRLQATLQTIRHRAEVQMDPAQDGGFFVKVIIYKELEDLSRPLRATAGAAAFQGEMTMNRTFEVIDPTVFESSWIPLGRDVEFEQTILQRLKRCM